MAGSLASANVLVCVPVTREHSCSGLSHGACALLAPIDLDELGWLWKLALPALLAAEH